MPLPNNHESYKKKSTTNALEKLHTITQWQSSCKRSQIAIKITSLLYNIVFGTFFSEKLEDLICNDRPLLFPCSPVHNNMTLLYAYHIRDWMNVQWFIHTFNSSRIKGVSLQMTDWGKGVYYSHIGENRLSAKQKDLK